MEEENLFILLDKIKELKEKLKNMESEENE